MADAIPEKEKRPTPNELAAGFNEFCAVPYGLPQVTVPLSPSRAAKARSRLVEHPDPEWWSRVFALVGRSLFLRGNGKGSWRMDFDWLVKNADNAVKISEGGYQQQSRRA